MLDDTIDLLTIVAVVSFGLMIVLFGVQLLINRTKAAKARDAAAPPARGGSDAP